MRMGRVPKYPIQPIQGCNLTNLVSKDGASHIAIYLLVERIVTSGNLALRKSRNSNMFKHMVDFCFLKPHAKKKED